MKPAYLSRKIVNEIRSFKLSRTQQEIIFFTYAGLWFLFVTLAVAFGCKRDTSPRDGSDDISSMLSKGYGIDEFVYSKPSTINLDKDDNGITISDVCEEIGDNGMKILRCEFPKSGYYSSQFLSGYTYMFVLSEKIGRNESIMGHRVKREDDNPNDKEFYGPDDKGVWNP